MPLAAWSSSIAVVKAITSVDSSVWMRGMWYDPMAIRSWSMTTSPPRITPRSLTPSGEPARLSKSSEVLNTSRALSTVCQPAWTIRLSLIRMIAGSWYIPNAGPCPVGLGRETYSVSSTAPFRAFSRARFTPSMERSVGSLPKPVLVPWGVLKATLIPRPEDSSDLGSSTALLGMREV